MSFSRRQIAHIRKCLKEKPFKNTETTLSFVFLFTSSGEIPILYLQPELKKTYPFRWGEPARKANIGIGPSWVISSLCNSLEPGSLVGKKAKKGGETAKNKSG